MICLLFAVGMMGDQARADSDRDRLVKGPTVTVTEVVDGCTVIINPPIDGTINGATEVRLAAIQCPKLSPGRKNFPSWPMAGEARAALTALLLGERVTLYYGDRKTDRYNRILAHIRTGDFVTDEFNSEFADEVTGGLWAQERMLMAGMARVWSFQDNRTGITALLRREQAARTARTGIWSHPYYAVRTAETVAAFINRPEIVTGTVRTVAEVKGRIYLNFGDDWRQDFTVSVDKKSRKLFDHAGIDLLALTGKSVRVRGWVKNHNGPLITLDHPERLEILD